ncbi:MAG TPA: NAD(P)/FAD-dependent oxidoreductase [Thermoleophilaceae bacterium]|nr:NAD(P)/FAD-dependent oxidoreductase [Thermoleophilaceae bacterium]
MSITHEQTNGNSIQALPSQVEVAVIGAGFSGLATARTLLRAGFDDIVVLERGTDVGGTWRDNDYPGCACDVPSHLYSFSFAPNPEWSSTFSGQPEIQDYIRRVARDEGLLPLVRFGAAVENAAWDEDDRRWTIETARGTLTARHLIAAGGPLSAPAIPEVPGLGSFPGKLMHSAAWDHDHDLSGERVAVIGTGASAIQFVPAIRPEVSRLHLFQRTAPWVMPRPDRQLTRVERRLYRRFPVLQHAMRNAISWAREAFALPMLHPSLARLVRLHGLRHLRKQIPDPALREKVTPDYLPGCKRILISNDYLPSLAKPNVEVIAAGLAEVRGSTVVGADGSEREVDTIIFGTGFHVTDLPIADRIHGRGGRTLADYWDGSLRAHRGTTVAGFPNLFFVLGPNTGTGHTSVLLMAEAQAAYVARALRHLRSQGHGTVEVTPEAEARWNDELQRRMRGTVWTSGGCQSWYLDRNGRNTTLWPDFGFRFRQAVRRFDPAEHSFTPAAVPALPQPEPAAA